MPKRDRRKKSGEADASDNSVVIPLKSGFRVRINPLPPYYKDLVDDNIPFPEYPLRKIVLSAGDEIDWPYEPKDEHDNPEHEDYELYVQWKAADVEREQLTKIRKRARMDFLLSSCIDILDGPVDITDDEWVERVEAAFEGWTMPTHPGRKRLIFLKTQVITDSDDMEIVVSLSTAAEVTMQGILSALRGFQSDLGQGGNGEDSGELAKEQVVAQS